jgi:FkbM family methyltransferase
MLRLYKVGDSGHHSVKHDFRLDFVNVKARSPGNVLNELSVKYVDWIKVDIEDSEYEVLLGLRETLKRCNPEVIAEV